MRRTDQDSIVHDNTDLARVLESCGTSMQELAGLSGLSYPTLARNRHGVNRNISVGNLGRLANTLGYALDLKLVPVAIPTAAPVVIKPDGTPAGNLHPLVAGPVQVARDGKTGVMPTVLHGVVAEMMAPHEWVKVRAMADPAIAFKLHPKYQWMKPVGEVLSEVEDLLYGMYWRYVTCSDPQLEQPERFIETLVATGGRSLVVTAPRSCHLQHHHWSKCPFCRNKPGVNRAGGALMRVRKDLLG